MRSAFAPVALPLAALIASLVRWWLQGSGNLYTALEKRFYVPDPDLGWQIASEHPIWLGLEVCAIILAIACGVAVGGWVIRSRDARGKSTKGLRIAAWIAGALPLVVPIAAFASGSGIAGARDTLPDATASSIGEGISGSLDLPSGMYDVVKHAGTSISARITAGKEAFDARFTDVRGTFVGDPRDLRAPSNVEIQVATASVDTGITPRSNSARDEYLQAAKFPRITFTLDKLVAAKPGSGHIAFRAKGTVGLLGKTHAVEVTGALSKPDDAALARLGLRGAILIVQADFALVIADTALAPDANDFDTPTIPIHVSLVMEPHR